MATNKLKPYPPSALADLQQVEREILVACSDLCDKLGIDSWFIDSGTCLGAVRHGGFIPWDDDIDIGMKLDDYKRFVEAAPKMLPAEYGIYTHGETPNYPPLWAKVYKKGTRFIGERMLDADFDEGIFVDVFAYMRLDSNEAKAKKQANHALFWQRMSYLYYTAHPKIRGNVPCRGLVEAGCVAAHGIVRAIYTPKSIEKNFAKVEKMGDGQGKWVNIFYPADGLYETETLFPTKDIAFDGYSFPAPRDIDVYLTELYGDYMKLPPEEERAAFPSVILDFGDGVNAMDRDA